MKPFQSKLKDEPNATILTLSGALDTSFKLPPVNQFKKLIILFQDIPLMSSAGIKTWCNWSRGVKNVEAIYLKECPFPVAKNFSLIKGFLSENMVVESFYIPYYNEATSESKFVLLERGKDFFDNVHIQVPKIKDSTGKEMEPDVDLPSYFSWHIVKKA